MWEPRGLAILWAFTACYHDEHREADSSPSLAEGVGSERAVGSGDTGPTCCFSWFSSVCFYKRWGSAASFRIHFLFIHRDSFAAAWFQWPSSVSAGRPGARSLRCQDREGSCHSTIWAFCLRDRARPRKTCHDSRWVLRPRYEVRTSRI
jgi:hypothetical protein